MEKKTTKHSTGAVLEKRIPARLPTPHAVHTIGYTGTARSFSHIPQCSVSPSSGATAINYVNLIRVLHVLLHLGVNHSARCAVAENLVRRLEILEMAIRVRVLGG